MEEEKKATEIVSAMYSKDAFSQWLGIEVKTIRPGYCQLQMTIRPEMLNGFGIAHGAITYALADSALAFASNARGRHAVSIETSIAHIEPLRAGETIVAEAREEQLGRRLARYRIEVRKVEGTELSALFRGTVYRKDTPWEV